MTDPAPSFDALALAHLDAAYNLARWLVRDEHVAQDVVQDAYLRGLRYFDSFRGGDIRPWLLGIVRNVCYTWLERHQGADQPLEFDDERDSDTHASLYQRGDGNPEGQLARKQERERVSEAIAALAPAFREVVILRDLEGLSYEEIAQVAGIPAGTVMSRLARAREQLRLRLAGLATERAS